MASPVRSDSDWNDTPRGTPLVLFESITAFGEK
jgi:hypothetical protein